MPARSPKLPAQPRPIRTTETVAFDALRSVHKPKGAPLLKDMGDDEVSCLANAVALAFEDHRQGIPDGLPPRTGPFCGDERLPAERTLALLERMVAAHIPFTAETIESLRYLAAESGADFAREALVRARELYEQAWQLDQDIPF